MKWFLVGCGVVGWGAIWLGGVSWVYLLPGCALPGGIASAVSTADYALLMKPLDDLLKTNIDVRPVILAGRRRAGAESRA